MLHVLIFDVRLLCDDATRGITHHHLDAADANDSVLSAFSMHRFYLARSRSLFLPFQKVKTNMIIGAC